MRWCCAALAAAGLASCANNTEATKASSPRKSGQILALSEGEGAAALEKRYGFQNSDIQRDENGNFKGGKRSRYDGLMNNSFGGGVTRAPYRGNTVYQAPRWNGAASGRPQPYSGSTDGSRFHTSSRFQSTRAPQGSQRSPYEGATARTSTYRTGRAPEHAATRLEKPADAWTQFRRRVYPEPTIIPEADYNRLTVEQTRSILGRTD